MLKLLSISLLSLLLLSGCNQPKEAEQAQLDTDIQALMTLSKAYEAGEIEALAYLTESRVLRKKIAKEEELLGSGHTHIH